MTRYNVLQRPTTRTGPSGSLALGPFVGGLVRVRGELAESLRGSGLLYPKTPPSRNIQVCVTLNEHRGTMRNHASPKAAPATFPPAIPAGLSALSRHAAELSRPGYI